MSTTRRQRKKILTEKKENFKPLNLEQEDYVNAIYDNHIIITIGKSGTGKTHCSAAIASELLNSGEIDRIIVTRAAAQADDIGYVKGDEVEKITPALSPILEELSQFINVNKEINDGRLKVCSLAFMRGVNFKRSIAILEEMQNCTYKQLKLFITRLGEGSKLILS